MWLEPKIFYMTILERKNKFSVLLEINLSLCAHKLMEIYGKISKNINFFSFIFFGNCENIFRNSGVTPSIKV